MIGREVTRKLPDMQITLRKRTMKELKTEIPSDRVLREMLPDSVACVLKLERLVGEKTKGRNKMNLLLL